MARFTFAKWAGIALVIASSAGSVAVANESGGGGLGCQYRSSTAATMNAFAAAGGLSGGLSDGLSESFAGQINSRLQ